MTQPSAAGPLLVLGLEKNVGQIQNTLEVPLVRPFTRQRYQPWAFVPRLRLSYGKLFDIRAFLGLASPSLHSPGL
jgi:hypothetical protein